MNEKKESIKDCLKRFAENLEPFHIYLCESKQENELNHYISNLYDIIKLQNRIIRDCNISINQIKKDQFQNEHTNHALIVQYKMIGKANNTIFNLHQAISNLKYLFGVK